MYLWLEQVTEDHQTASMFKGKMASPITTLGKQSNWFWSLTFEQGGLTSAWLYVWQWNGCMLGIRDGLTLALSSSVITPSSYLKMKLIQDLTFTYNNQWPLVYNGLRGWMNDLYWPAWVLDWKVCCPAGLVITTLCSVALGCVFTLCFSTEIVGACKVPLLQTQQSPCYSP